MFKKHFLKPLMAIKTEEKQFRAKKFVWTTPSEKTGPKRENNVKNDQF